MNAIVSIPQDAVIFHDNQLRTTSIKVAEAFGNPRGSTCSGTDTKGNKWEVKMHSHYGYIKRTEGAGGDHVDVFIGPNPESEKVFVVDQINPEGSFDEHKVLIGFDSKLHARSGYKSNYSNGWKVGPITSMSMDEFKSWVKNGDTKKPLSTAISNEIKKPRPSDGVSVSEEVASTEEAAKLLVIDKPESGEVKYKLETKTTKPISRESAQAVIDRISKDWKVKVKINLISSIDELPDSVKSRLHKAGDEQGEPAALIDESTGHVYINLSKAASERSVEELIFHEVYTHFGLRQLMGEEVGSIMGRLCLSLGASEVERYGVNIDAYEKAYKGRSVEMRQAIIAEELLAHMSEHAKPAVVKFAQELIGAIRAWLRKSGFAELAKISDSDMRYLLKQARETVTKGKQGDITGLIYNLVGMSKLDVRALIRQG